MASLIRGEQVLCQVDVAEAPMERLRGLLGVDGVDGALVFPRCRSVHTMGMRFAIDVAFLDKQGRVVDMVAPMVPWRLGRTRLRARQVLEAESGAFVRWGLSVGDVLEIK